MSPFWQGIFIGFILGFGVALVATALTIRSLKRYKRAASTIDTKKE